MDDCIVLAAGASSRMGSWKLLLPWKGLTVVETVVEEAVAAGCRVILVAGHRSEDLAELFAGHERVTVVVHEGWRKGQFTSLRRGLTEVRTNGFFVTLADLPGVTRDLFRDLAAQRGQSAGSSLPRAFRPGSPSRPGHPVLFDAEALPVIAGLDPSLSMREVFPHLALTFCALGPEGAYLDVDVPQDYAPGALDLSRTQCPPRLAAEAMAAAARLTSAP